MDKTQLEKLIKTKDLIFQSMEVLDKIKKSQKIADRTNWIITFGVLLVIGILALIFFL